MSKTVLGQFGKEGLHVSTAMEVLGHRFVRYDARSQPGVSGTTCEVSSPADGITEKLISTWRDLARDRIEGSEAETPVKVSTDES